MGESKGADLSLSKGYNLIGKMRYIITQINVTLQE